MLVSRISIIEYLKSWVIKVFHSETSTNISYDGMLLWLTLGLICIGFVMVTSASMPIGVRLFDDPFYFTKRDALHLSFAFLLSLITLHIPMAVWQRYSLVMLLLTMLLLLMVLVFGNSVNGASRWIAFGSLHIQPAELSKITMFCYLARYLTRKTKEVRNNFGDFCKPIEVMILLAVLLLAQPDLGTVFVLFVTTLSILFLAGAKLWQSLLIMSSGICSVVLLIIIQPYRINRITSFWNPWEDPFGNGYQLTQSLIAFGRGEFWGQGLGNSVQKLEYLPEAHTDFIFAILGEELGFFGVILVLIMVFLVAFRAMYIGRQALEMNKCFSGFLACSIGIWFSYQALINIGVTAGMLPIKGLTLPFISYGGSSLLIMLIAIALLLRIDFETRLARTQAFAKRVW